MRISIITVTKNSSSTIARAMKSVRDQEGVAVEHIVKDACSTDDTVAIAAKINPSSRIIVEPDANIYDAMNQGFLSVSGEIVAYLNSDDHYSDNFVLRDVDKLFTSTGCDYVYGDIEMINAFGKVVRKWRTGEIGADGLVGKQIPHPAFFVRKSVLEKLHGPFDPTYKISGDLKQQLIIINKHHAKGCYLSRTVTIMRMGGESTRALSSYINGWKESYRAYNEVFGAGGALFVIGKVFSKLKQVRAMR